MRISLPIGASLVIRSHGPYLCSSWPNSVAPTPALRHRCVFCMKRAMSDTFRRTKIIFTLGPATESEEMLEKLFRAGADVVRLNMAHASHDWTRAVVRRIRAVSARVGRDV